MNSQTAELARRQAIPVRSQSLFVNPMASFMQRTEKSRTEKVFVKPGVDTAIVRAQFRAERMVGCIQPAALEVEANLTTGREGQLALSGLGKMSFQDIDR